jgi:hypothetical protein
MALTKLVTKNFAELVSLNALTNEARANTINYKWIPYANNVYTWKTTTYIAASRYPMLRLYSSNTTLYNTGIRTFDGVDYGEVTSLRNNAQNTEPDTNIKLIVDGNQHTGTTLIIAYGTVQALVGTEYNLIATISGSGSLAPSWVPQGTTPTIYQEVSNLTTLNFIANLGGPNLTAKIDIVKPANGEPQITRNLRWTPDETKTYKWESQTTDTFFRLYSSDLQTYTTNTRTFDGIEYGLVSEKDELVPDLSTTLLVDGNTHRGKTLIIALGLNSIADDVVRFTITASVVQVEVTREITTNFTNEVIDVTNTLFASRNTINYSFTPIAGSIYSLVASTIAGEPANKPQCNLYSNNIQAYPTNTRMFDGESYGLVSSTEDLFNITVDGNIHNSTILILACGSYTTWPAKYYLSCNTAGIWTLPQVITTVTNNFTATLLLTKSTNNATQNTRNYKLTSLEGTTYRWKTSNYDTEFVSTCFKIYSSNILTYTTEKRFFDGIEYGLVITKNNSVQDVVSSHIINGSAHKNETLITVFGLSGTTVNRRYNIKFTKYEPQVISNICFPAGTPVTTNQGIIHIDKINPDIHTIRNKKIVGVTQTTTPDKYLVCFEKDSIEENIPSQKTIISKNHHIFYKGQMIQAKKFLGKFENVKKIKYNREILYNVLMEEHDKMIVNNLICETLHPENTMAKLYNHLQKLNPEEKGKLIKKCNEYIIDNKLFTSKKTK